MNKILQLFSFYFTKPSKNITYEEFYNSEYIILGHFTTSIFLESILIYGINPSIDTRNHLNKDIILDSQNQYIYLLGHFDKAVSENAVKKFGGTEILILIKVKKNTLELDDVNCIYSKRGINITSEELIYTALTQSLFSQCRTKQNILPEQIIEIIDVSRLIRNELYLKEYFTSTKSLTLEKLKENIDINLLRFNQN